MNQIAYEKVLDKIVHKAVEEQDKNPNASIAHMFGYNEEQYCKELIKANRKKSFLEHMLHAFKVDVNVYLPLSAGIAIVISELINKIKRSVAIKNYNLG